MDSNVQWVKYRSSMLKIFYKHTHTSTNLFNKSPFNVDISELIVRNASLVVAVDYKSKHESIKLSSQTISLF